MGDEPTIDELKNHMIKTLDWVSGLTGYDVTKIKTAVNENPAYALLMLQGVLQKDAIVRNLLKDVTRTGVMDYLRMHNEIIKTVNPGGYMFPIEEVEKVLYEKISDQHVATFQQIANYFLSVLCDDE